jgi:death-on-curing protein
MTTHYISVEDVFIIHKRMIAIGGGSAGLRDMGLLYSAVERPKATFGGRDLYPSLFYKAGALLQSLMGNHPFEDGNKRTGFFSTLFFLEQNNIVVHPTEKDIIAFCSDVVVKKYSIEQISTWLEIHVQKEKKK